MRHIDAYWWSPRRDHKELTKEVLFAHRAWLHASAFGGRNFSNFGDELSPMLFEIGFGESVTISWADIDKAQLFGVGSIIHKWFQSDKHAYVWGSGIGDPLKISTSGLSGPQLSRILAVRGKLSRELLGLGKGVALGDPALLLDSGLPKKSDTQQYTLVPHYLDFRDSTNLKTFRRFEMNGWKVLSPLENPTHIIAELARSKFVVSSSLHGKIVSDALGIPCALTKFSTFATFKYFDYLSLWGDEPEFVDPIGLLESKIQFRRIFASAQRSQERVNKSIGTYRMDLTESLRSLDV